MPLIQLVIILAVVGVLLWLVNRLLRQETMGSFQHCSRQNDGAVVGLDADLITLEVGLEHV